ncbi:response regulator transcription factor [Sphingomonas sp. 1P08PE]|uniref:response regulator transcription factor n=1 Tax=Sphingomonas sp. 1P08PE TaxID=554122 RepID=UPI0039A36E7F
MFDRDNLTLDQGSPACRHAGDRTRNPAGERRRSLVHIVDGAAEDRDAVDAMLQASDYPTRSWCSVDAFRSGLDPAKPGCLVLFLCAAGVDGPAMVRRLAQLPCALSLVALSRCCDTRQATAIMKAGAIDFLDLPPDPDALCVAIEDAAGCLDQWQRQAAITRDACRRLALLSPREREVLDGLLAGASNKVIAQDLAISARTVEIHRARVMAKLEAGSLAQLIRTAIAAEMRPPWQTR